MAKIKSTVELIYDTRSQKSGIIQIEINSWNFDANNKRYIAIVDDYVFENIEVQVTNEDLTISTVIQVQKKLISSSKKNYTKEQIDGLFMLLQNPINLTESYTEEMDSLISSALLYKTQNEPIYGSIATQWVIVTN